MAEFVILVDEHDQQVGVGEKMEAHVKAQLHRAFSIILVNANHELLLQQRAQHKYHSAGLWANTCCGHPRPDESLAKAASRRLYEEMGIQCDLTEIFAFRYTVQLDNKLSENEYDHVFLGWCDDLQPQPDPDEVADWRWMDLASLKQDGARHPERYAHWFKILVKDPRLAEALEVRSEK
jgi:isopentenyl-diphosphate Delta-isomerase